MGCSSSSFFRLAESGHAAELQNLLQSMTTSISASRASLKSFLEVSVPFSGRRLAGLNAYGDSPQSLDFADGISLLSLKHNVMISYLRSLALLSARRALGHSLQDRSQPTLPFSDIGRDERGHGSGDLVDSMIEGRVVLEKADALESRMRYQIEKLLKTAEQTDGDAVTNGMLTYTTSMHISTDLHFLLRPACVQAQPPKPCRRR